MIPDSLADIIRVGKETVKCQKANQLVMGLLFEPGGVLKEQRRKGVKSENENKTTSSNRNEQMKYRKRTFQPLSSRLI
jgi:hypothetical protein